MSGNSPPVQRYFENGVLISTGLPAIRVWIDPAFHYVGNLESDLKGIARVDRHFFLDAAGAHIRRMIVFQFEGFLAGNDYTYNYRPLDPVVLGGISYNHNTYFFSNAQSIAEDPGSEPEHTARFLASLGYHLEDEHMTSRFVRVVDDQKRDELIIFYFENISSTGLSLAEIAEDGGVREAYSEIAAGLTRRSLQSFEIL